jgi:aldose 1-epimerase
VRGLGSYDTVMFPPSGEQILLIHGGFEAVITEVGATLRSFLSDQKPIIWGFPEAEISSYDRGQVLAPWPNRLEDGSYRFGNVVGRAAINEPERSVAIHGFVRCLPWSIEERAADRALLSCLICSQPAYPFRVRVALEYSLGDGGLEVACEVTNDGSGIAPFGLGFHPYLFAGPGGIDEASVRLSAERRMLLDKRGLPTGEEVVAGSAFDLAHRKLRGLELDDCYTGLAIGADGRWHAHLDLAGRHSEIWADAAFGYAMCYTGDTLGELENRRIAMAIEPMTCPPNGLRTGTSLIELREGEPWRASWGIATSLD